MYLEISEIYKWSKQIIILLFLFVIPIAWSSSSCSASNMMTTEVKQEQSLDFDKVLVKKVLLEDGYSNEEADKKIQSIYDWYDDRLYDVINAYVRDRTILDNINVQGVTMRVLIERRKYNFWDALYMLNETISNPRLAPLLRLPLITEETYNGEKKTEDKSGKNKFKQVSFLRFDKVLAKKQMLADRPTRTDVDALIWALTRADAKLQKVVDDYLAKGEITDDFNWEGMTIPIIMAWQGNTFWDALFSMDVYIENPGSARVDRENLDKNPLMILLKRY